MVDTKIKDLTAKTTVVDSDEIVINDVADGNTDKKEGLDDIKTFMSSSPTLVTPALGTPSSGTLTNCTGLPITGITSSTSAELATLISDETGTNKVVFSDSPTLVTPALGTPASGVSTNLTGTSGITGLGTMTTDIEMGGTNIQSGGVIFLREQAEADADVTAEGQIWVDTQTPNKLFFTNDAGTDFELGVVVSLTPWTTDIDADGFDLNDLSNLDVL